MYFTNTPSLNSMEAIMQKPPGGAQRGGGKKRSPYKYTKKDCDCRFCLYYRKRKAALLGYVPCWTFGFPAVQLLSVKPSKPHLRR